MAPFLMICRCLLLLKVFSLHTMKCLLTFFDRVADDSFKKKDKDTSKIYEKYHKGLNNLSKLHSWGTYKRNI